MNGQLITLTDREGFAEAARRIRTAEAERREEAATRAAEVDQTRIRAGDAVARLLLWGKVGWCVATLLMIALVLTWLLLVPAAR